MVTCVASNFTRDTWHLTHEIWWEVNILSKCQLSSSYGLGVMMFWRFGGKWRVSGPVIIISSRDGSQVNQNHPLTTGVYLWVCKYIQNGNFPCQMEALTQTMGVLLSEEMNSSGLTNGKITTWNAISTVSLIWNNINHLRPAIQSFSVLCLACLPLSLSQELVVGTNNCWLGRVRVRASTELTPQINTIGIGALWYKVFWVVFFVVLSQTVMD